MLRRSFTNGKQKGEGGKIHRMQHKRALQAYIKSEPFPETDGEPLTGAKEANDMIIFAFQKRALVDLYAMLVSARYFPEIS